MKKFYDFDILVKNFSAVDVIDSRDLRMYDRITYRNGKNKSEVQISDFKELMMYNLQYLEIIGEAETTDIIGWLKYFVKSQYAFSIIDTEKKILKARIRLFDIDSAFKFKIQYFDYVLENK